MDLFLELWDWSFKSCKYFYLTVRNRLKEVTSTDLHLLNGSKVITTSALKLTPFYLTFSLKGERSREFKSFFLRFHRIDILCFVEFPLKCKFACFNSAVSVHTTLIRDTLLNGVNYFYGSWNNVMIINVRLQTRWIANLFVESHNKEHLYSIEFDYVFWISVHHHIVGDGKHMRSVFHSTHQALTQFFAVNKFCM